MLFWLSVISLLALLVMRTSLSCSSRIVRFLTFLDSNIPVPSHPHLPCSQLGEVSLPETHVLYPNVDV